jgi:hypothetical protein
MFDPEILSGVYGLNPTIMWIAVTVGLLLYVIGYFAGGRLTIKRILMCTIVVTVVGVLALPVPMAVFKLVKQQYNVKVVYDNPSNGNAPVSPQAPASSQPDTTNLEQPPKKGAPVSLQAVTLFIYILWTAFLVGMGIFFYETLIVTTQEADRR